MNFTQSITTCMSKYATFSGTASRSEYWWFVLFVTLVGYASNITDSLVYGPLYEYEWGDPDTPFHLNTFIWALAVIIPGFAAGSRRLHDIGKSGWWQLLYITIIGIIPLTFWLAQDTKNKDNQFKPKSRRSTKTRVSQ